MKYSLIELLSFLYKINMLKFKFVVMYQLEETNFIMFLVNIHELNFSTCDWFWADWSHIATQKPFITGKCTTFHKRIPYFNFKWLSQRLCFSNIMPMSCVKNTTNTSRPTWRHSASTSIVWLLSRYSIRLSQQHHWGFGVEAGVCRVNVANHCLTADLSVIHALNGTDSGLS